MFWRFQLVSIYFHRYCRIYEWLRPGRLTTEQQHTYWRRIGRFQKHCLWGNFGRYQEAFNQAGARFTPDCCTAQRLMRHTVGNSANNDEPQGITAAMDARNFTRWSEERVIPVKTTPCTSAWDFTQMSYSSKKADLKVIIIILVTYNFIFVRYWNSLFARLLCYLYNISELFMHIYMQYFTNFVKEAGHSFRSKNAASNFVGAYIS